MEKYEFTATTSKSDIIIGFAFPAMLMLPILAINLTLFYLGPDNFIKENPLFLYLIIIIFMAGVFLLIRKVQERLIKKYSVEIYGNSIRIWLGNDKILSGIIRDCKLSIKMDGVNAKSINLNIYTDSGNIKLRARAKEFRKITGVMTRNPLGTSEMRDMDEIYSLAQKIRM
ncbi:Uncharacterised protein [[Eubacterium] infirmum]|nr:Uncharacterised protein [[Eubacterium] infirmum]